MMTAGGEASALALVAAIVWGTSDFCGGIVTRRTTPAIVLMIAHGLGLLALLLAVVFHPSGLPTRHTMVFGLIAGLAGGVGLLALYKGLSLGSMGLVAALSGRPGGRCPCAGVIFQRVQTLGSQTGRFCRGLRCHLADRVFSRHQRSPAWVGTRRACRRLLRTSAGFSSRCRKGQRALGDDLLTRWVGFLCRDSRYCHREEFPNKSRRRDLSLVSHTPIGCGCGHSGYHGQSALHGIFAHRATGCGGCSVFSISRGHDFAGGVAAEGAGDTQPDSGNDTGNSCSSNDFGLGLYAAVFRSFSGAKSIQM